VYGYSPLLIPAFLSLLDTAGITWIIAAVGRVLAVLGAPEFLLQEVVAYAGIDG